MLVATQDPAARPTAEQLLQHAFLQNAAAPPSLQQIIAAQSVKRDALGQLHHDVPAYQQQTMPRWSFGTQPASSEQQLHTSEHQSSIPDSQLDIPEQQAGAPEQLSAAQLPPPLPRRSGTLKSHQINMTFRDDGTVRHNPAPRHPSLAIMAQLAEAGLVSDCIPTKNQMQAFGASVSSPYCLCALQLPSFLQHLRYIQCASTSGVHACTMTRSALHFRMQTWQQRSGIVMQSKQPEG